MSAREFEDISIPKWKLAINGAVENAAERVYRVYSNKNEFVTVQAISATEAAAKSGLTNVYMIKFGQMDDMTMLDRSMLMADAPPGITAPVEINQIPPQ